MGTIWWFIKTGFYILLAGCVAGTVYFFATRDNKINVEFSGGSSASLQASGPWCADHNRLIGFVAKQYHYFHDAKNISHIYEGDCEVQLTETPPAITVRADEFSAEKNCTGLQTTSVDLHAPGGNANLCTAADRASPSGYVLMINYPVDGQHSLSVILDYGLWRNHNADIAPILKTFHYSKKV